MPSLTNGDIFVLVSKQIAGEGTAADAVLLIQYFVSCMKSGEEIDNRLLSYIARQFDAYLSQQANTHHRTLEQCFGLAVGKGRATTAERDIEICTRALRAFISDESNRPLLVDCLLLAVEEMRSAGHRGMALSNERLISIWRQHKWEAFGRVHTSRIIETLGEPDAHEWTDIQTARLRKLKLID